MALETEMSISVLEEKLKSNPLSLIFSRLADSYRKSGDVQKAIEISTEGLESHPDYVTGRIILGRCYLEQENFNDAIKEFTKICTLDRRNQIAIKMLADVFSKQGMEEKAGDLYQMLLRMDPDNPSLIHLASVFAGTGSTDVFEVLGIEDFAAPLPISKAEVSEEDVEQELEASLDEAPLETAPPEATPTLSAEETSEFPPLEPSLEDQTPQEQQLEEMPLDAPEIPGQEDSSLDNPEDKMEVLESDTDKVSEGVVALDFEEPSDSGKEEEEFTLEPKEDGDPSIKEIHTLQTMEPEQSEESLEIEDSVEVVEPSADELKEDELKEEELKEEELKEEELKEEEALQAPEELGEELAIPLQSEEEGVEDLLNPQESTKDLPGELPPLQPAIDIEEESTTSDELSDRMDSMFGEEESIEESLPEAIEPIEELTTKEVEQQLDSEVQDSPEIPEEDDLSDRLEDMFKEESTEPKIPEFDLQGSNEMLEEVELPPLEEEKSQEDGIPALPQFDTEEEEGTDQFILDETIESEDKPELEVPILEDDPVESSIESDVPIQNEALNEEVLTEGIMTQEVEIEIDAPIESEQPFDKATEVFEVEQQESLIEDISTEQDDPIGTDDEIEAEEESEQTKIISFGEQTSFETPEPSQDIPTIDEEGTEDLITDATAVFDREKIKEIASSVSDEIEVSAESPISSEVMSRLDEMFADEEGKSETSQLQKPETSLYEFTKTEELSEETTEENLPSGKDVASHFDEIFSPEQPKEEESFEPLPLENVEESELVSEFYEETQEPVIEPETPSALDEDFELSEDEVQKIEQVTKEIDTIEDDTLDIIDGDLSLDNLDLDTLDDEDDLELTTDFYTEEGDTADSSETAIDIETIESKDEAVIESDSDTEEELKEEEPVAFALDLTNTEQDQIEKVDPLLEDDSLTDHSAVDAIPDEPIEEESAVHGEFYTVAGDEAVPEPEDVPQVEEAIQEEVEEEAREDTVKESDFLGVEEKQVKIDSMQQDDFIKGKAESIPDHVLTPTLADIYFQQGQPYLAVQIYKRLLERDPDNDRMAERIEEIEKDIKEREEQQELATLAGEAQVTRKRGRPKKKEDEGKKRPLKGVRIKKKVKARINKKKTSD